jgi:hypothetical protein
MKKWLIMVVFLAHMSVVSADDSSRASCSERQLSEKGQQACQKRMAKELKAATSGMFLQSALIASSLPNVYYPPEYHFLRSASGVGDSVEIEDGSVWQICKGGTKTLSWKSSDPLVITQSHRWFSSYTYSIINTQTSEKVDVKLQFGPLSDSEWLKKVDTVDIFRREITLDNQTVWKVSIFDRDMMNEYKKGDAVIIGTNSSSISFKKNILINVAINNYIRVSPKEVK